MTPQPPMDAGPSTGTPALPLRPTTPSLFRRVLSFVLVVPAMAMPRRGRHLPGLWRMTAGELRQRAARLERDRGDHVLDDVELTRPPAPAKRGRH